MVYVFISAMKLFLSTAITACIGKDNYEGKHSKRAKRK